MLVYYKKKINDWINKLLPADFNGITIVESIFQEIVKEIFSEKCIIYIDKLSDFKYLIEIHFEDCNFYEIILEGTDNRTTITKKIVTNLIEERLTDKNNIDVNGNNERYFRVNSK